MRHRSTALLRLRVVHAGCALRCSRTQYVTIAYCCGWRGVVAHKRHVRGACARNRILRTAAWLLRANLGTAQASCVLCRAAPCIALACGAGLLIELALDIRERMRRSRRGSAVHTAMISRPIRSSWRMRGLRCQEELRRRARCWYGRPHYAPPYSAGN